MAVSPHAAVEDLKFLTEDQVVALSSQFPTPVFIYSEERIVGQIQKALAFPVNEGYGLTIRFAMKANPNKSILGIMKKHGVKIDASSEHEVHRAIAAGFEPNEIKLTAQQLARDLKGLVTKGVQFNACSLKQLKAYGELFPGTEVSIRWNPGKGSGAMAKMDVGGATSSFGVWHEQIAEVKAIAKEYNLIISKVHTHIGSGSDPEVWKLCADLTLKIAEQFPDCKTVNLGGGFKVARMADEKSTDMQLVGTPVKELFKAFFERTGKKLHLELEPGSYYMVNSGSILCEVDDLVDTGKDGFKFLKVNTGMDAITRPSLYGARHPIVVVPRDQARRQTPFENRQIDEYVVVGHCCESGDMITQSIGGSLQTRPMHTAYIGDLVVIEGTGAYCSSMCTKNYNSFPELAEVLITTSGEFKLIRRQQTFEQMLANEL